MWDPPPVDWTDVVFDAAAARDAADACDRLADLLADVADWSRTSLAHLASTWEGGLADEFATREGGLQVALAGRHDELRIRAAGLRDAAVAASEEQARREVQRDRWHDWDRRRRRCRQQEAS